MYQSSWTNPPMSSGGGYTNNTALTPHHHHYPTTPTKSRSSPLSHLTRTSHTFTLHLSLSLFFIQGLALPRLVYLVAQSEGRHLSLSAVDRRMGEIYL